MGFLENNHNYENLHNEEVITREFISIDPKQV